MNKSEESSMSKLNDMKRRHNSIHEDGCEHYKKMMSIYKEMQDLHEQIKEMEGADYDPIPLIFRRSHTDRSRR